SISPRRSRWNAWLWTLAKPGIVQPLSTVASWGANASSSTDLMRPLSTSMSTFSARRPIHACSACHLPDPFKGRSSLSPSGRGLGEGLHLPLPVGERAGERGRRWSHLFPHRDAHASLARDLESAVVAGVGV